MFGQAISHYKIIEKLGEGGMGVVYKAEDTKLKRLVALKFLPSSIMASEAEKTRFVHEAQAAAALNHPNICTIYEIDEADGQSFIAMEFVEGQSLKGKIEAGPLKLDEAINIAGQIAEGLQAAHEKKITHRDIKPANVMITTKGQAKIMDFGLAKQAGRTVVTKEGMTLGTVAYMSPEQARGEEVDRRTDVWALGVVFYEMLTGQSPFKGVYEQAVVYSILSENPEPITGLRTGVPMELERIVNKCLDKQAAQRYQHADDLLADLRRLQLEPKSATRPAPKTTIAEPPKKPSLRLALPLAMLAVAIILGVGYLFFSREAESKERIPIAVVDFINETEDKELNGLSGMLITALEQSQRLSVVTRSRMYDVLKQMGKQGIDRIDEGLGKEICRRANVTAMAIASIRKFDRLYTIDLKVIDPIKDQHLFAGSEKGEGKASVPLLIDKLAERTRKGLKEQEIEIQAASPKVADITTPNLEAYQHYFLGEQAINKLRFDEAIQEFEKAVALDSTFALAYYRLAYALAWKQGVEQLGKAPLQKALRLSDRLPEKERYFVRVEQARLEGGWVAALEILKEMESRYPNEKEMLFQIGDYSYHAGQLASAREYLEKVLAMDSTFARAIQHIIWVYGEAGEPQNMLAMAERYHALAPSEESYMLLGKAYIALGDFEKAAMALQRARELAPQS